MVSETGKGAHDKTETKAMTETGKGLPPAAPEIASEIDLGAPFQNRNENENNG